jgi:hypothetical protein
VAANFLGLAEIRLAAGDTAGALDLLRRLVVAVGAPFENLDSAAALLEKTGHNAVAVEFLDQLVKSAPWDSSYRLRLVKAKLAAGGDATAQDTLSAIASAPSAAYDLRLTAAAALTGRTHSELGSGELNLIASGKAAITPAAADKFYFYEARIRAAENSTDTQTKIQLLSHCAIDFPRRDAGRIPLFEAAADAHSYTYALGILEPLFSTQFLRADVVEAGREEEQIVSSGDEEDEENGDESGISVSAESQLTRAQRARVSQLIGDTMTRLSRFPDALSYYQAAHGLETSASARKALNRKIAETKSVLRIQRENAARQPLLHEALEQDRVVRPRLLARVMPASAAAGAKGGAKQ